MIRFLLFYFYVVVYRVCRIFFRAEITGDTNFLSSPLLTIKRVLSHPILGKHWTFVDIGCGEGLVGLFVRLIQKKAVILHDHQAHFLTMIQLFSRLFFIRKLRCSDTTLSDYPDPAVFLCVWTSWSEENRLNIIQQLTGIVPKGSFFISVSHGIIHPAFVEVHKMSETFAWGRASVYYYKHA